MLAQGIFPCLDSTCKTPKATDSSLAVALHQQHNRTKDAEGHAILLKPKAKGKGDKKQLSFEDAFILKHFAGDVTYVVHGWLDKNNDKLSDDYEKHMASGCSGAHLHSFVLHT